MKIQKPFYLFAGLFLAFALTVPAAWAAGYGNDSFHYATWNQASRLTFNQSVELPGNSILPAGTYWFVVANDAGNPNIVRVYNANRSKLLASLQTISADRIDPTVHSEFQFIEQSRNRPDALLTWYDGSCLIGHEFVYSNPRRKAVSSENVLTVMAHSANAPGA